jgi:hypothetical protein
MSEWASASRVEGLFNEIKTQVSKTVSAQEADGGIASLPSNSSLWVRSTRARITAAVCLILILLWLQGCRENPKVSSFRTIVSTLKSFPSANASDSERTKYNEHLSAQVNAFRAVPFDATTNTKDAIKIVGLYTQHVEGRYDGRLFYLLDDEVRGIAADLRTVEGAGLDQKIKSASTPFLGKVVVWITVLCVVVMMVAVGRAGFLYLADGDVAMGLGGLFLAFLMGVGVYLLVFVF